MSRERKFAIGSIILGFIPILAYILETIRMNTFISAPIIESISLNTAVFWSVFGGLAAALGIAFNRIAAKNRDERLLARTGLVLCIIGVLCALSEVIPILVAMLSEFVFDKPIII